MEAIKVITALAEPVLPEATAKVWQQLGLGNIAQADLKNIAWRGLAAGTKLGEAAPLFPRAEKDTVTRMKDIEENRPQSALEQALASIPTVRVEPPTASSASKPAENADTTAPEADRSQSPRPLRALLGQLQPRQRPQPQARSPSTISPKSSCASHRSRSPSAYQGRQAAPPRSRPGHGDAPDPCRHCRILRA